MEWAINVWKHHLFFFNLFTYLAASALVMAHMQYCTGFSLVEAWAQYLQHGLRCLMACGILVS